MLIRLRGRPERKKTQIGRVSLFLLHQNWLMLSLLMANGLVRGGVACFLPFLVRLACRAIWAMRSVTEGLRISSRDCKKSSYVHLR